MKRGLSILLFGFVLVLAFPNLSSPRKPITRARR